MTDFAGVCKGPEKFLSAFRAKRQNWQPSETTEKLWKPVLVDTCRIETQSKECPQQKVA